MWVVRCKDRRLYYDSTYGLCMDFDDVLFFMLFLTFNFTLNQQHGLAINPALFFYRKNT